MSVQEDARHDGSVQQAVAGRLLDSLVASSDLRDVLETVVELALARVSGCRSASVTVISEGTPVSLAVSDQDAEQIDRAQYFEGIGPSLVAARAGALIRIDDLGQEPRALPWQQRGVQAGITATVCIPIHSASSIEAALNLHTAQPGGWPPGSLEAGELLAAYAGDAITLAYRLNLPTGFRAVQPTSPRRPLRALHIYEISPQPVELAAPAGAAGSTRTEQHGPGVDPNASKEHLLGLARRLKIKGRSSMTKGALLRAIQDAGPLAPAAIP